MGQNDKNMGQKLKKSLEKPISFLNPISFLPDGKKYLLAQITVNKMVILLKFGIESKEIS